MNRVQNLIKDSKNDKKKNLKSNVLQEFSELDEAILLSSNKNNDDKNKNILLLFKLNKSLYVHIFKSNCCHFNYKFTRSNYKQIDVSKNKEIVKDIYKATKRFNVNRSSNLSFN